MCLKTGHYNSCQGRTTLSCVCVTIFCPCYDKTRISKLFRFGCKNKVPKPLRFYQIYSIMCESWNAIILTYIEKTFQLMKVRVFKHQDLFPRTGKLVKVTFSTPLRERRFGCNHKVTWDNFKLLMGLFISHNS